MITSLIPFYGGTDPQHFERNIGWLRATLESMAMNGVDAMFVGCCEIDDIYRVNHMLADWTTDTLTHRGDWPLPNVFQFSSAPMQLPMNLLRWAQVHVRDEFILFNEADQPMNIAAVHESFLDAIRRDPNRVIVPHRLVCTEGAPENWWGWGHWSSELNRFLYLYERVTIDGKEYVVHNRPAILDLHHDYPPHHFTMRSEVIEGVYYRNPDHCMAFSACYLVAADTFRRVKFEDKAVYSLEQSSFAVHATPGVQMLKPLNLCSLYVDHLSHRPGNSSTR